MKHTVKTEHGTLEFNSFGEVERAWLMGLVGPDDELLEEGKTVWRKCGSIAVLARARRTGEQAWGGSWYLWAVIGIGLGSIALYCLKEKNYLVGGLLGLITAFVTIHVSVKAAKRAKPHG